MTQPSKTSAVRVLGKSMYMFAAGWAISIGWLWVAEFQQAMQRTYVPPPYYGILTLTRGLLPTIIVAVAGLAVRRRTGRAPEPDLERREWWHAFWWAFAPNLQLLVTVWVMIQEAR